MGADVDNPYYVVGVNKNMTAGNCNCQGLWFKGSGSRAVIQASRFSGCRGFIQHRNETLTAQSSLISWKDIGMEGFVFRGGQTIRVLGLSNLLRMEDESILRIDSTMVIGPLLQSTLNTSA
nr:hypothetical protein [Tanacetum cinerariifolium]